MSVVHTQRLLYRMSELSKQQLGENVAVIQREIICEPLKAFFPKVSMEALHYELLRNGLFDPQEGMDLDKTVKKMEEKKVWQIVQGEYERLKRLWKGYEVPIYIFPLTKHRPIIEGIIANKNGITYNGILFLFVSTELGEVELKALFAHEYHHACRLAFLNKDLQKMLLKDSLVIEGMAECSVEELYGERWLSPWTKRYSLEEAQSFWNDYFVSSLNMKGVANHRPLLYGDESLGLPNWIGYCIGYKIVKSFQKNYGPVKQNILYRMPVDEIIAGSDFVI